MRDGKSIDRLLGFRSLRRLRVYQGSVVWIKQNLFSTWYNTLLTLLFLYILYIVVPSTLDWLFFKADFYTTSRELCTSGGACWGVVTRRFSQYLYGFYPQNATWRPNLAFVLLFVALLPILWHKMPRRNLWYIFSVFYFISVFWLLLGGYGLTRISTNQLGGLLLNIILGVTGIGLSLPVGIVLALARRSELPAIRFFAVTFIEFIRAVPMITVLFFATVVLPLFLPDGVVIDQLTRVIFIIIIFASAYMAEVIRGGLQGVDPGQEEAAKSLGLGYWKIMVFVILPQALRISIPGIVNTFIGLFKDTTLVITIGMFDILGVGRAALANKQWLGLANEVYIFVACVFFLFCYAMSRYSQYLEAKLSESHREESGKKSNTC